MVTGIHTLLDDTPALVAGNKKETVVIELVAVLHGSIIHFGRKFAGMDEGSGVGTAPVTGAKNIVGCFAAGFAFASADGYSHIGPIFLGGLLQGAADGCSHAAGMPVEANDTAKGLEPER